MPEPLAALTALASQFPPPDDDPLDLALDLDGARPVDPPAPLQSDAVVRHHDPERPIDPLEAETREHARRQLQAVKQRIQEKSVALLSAEPAQLPTLTQELQRLRVAMLMLREIVEDVADPTTYRELSLLNKMITGHDVEQEALRKEQVLGEQEAVDRIAKVGLSPESAGSMVRVLQSLQGVMNRRNGTPVEEEHTHE